LRRIQAVNDAARRDWRAAEFLLRADPATREEFGMPEHSASPGRIEVNVILPPDLSAMLSAARPAARVLEHAPADAAGDGPSSEGDEAA
jgi:hypothetical protein